MKRRCPKCSSFQFHSGERFDCKACGYSTDDNVVTRRKLATHRMTNVPSDITKALPSRKVNGGES